MDLEGCARLARISDVGRDLCGFAWVCKDCMGFHMQKLFWTQRHPYVVNGVESQKNLLRQYARIMHAICAQAGGQNKLQGFAWISRDL